MSSKTEEEARIKAAQASNQYKQALKVANNLRDEYIRRYLPRYVRVAHFKIGLT